MEMTPTQIFLVFLPYGAVFFAIGVAITSRRKSFTNLKIAGLFWLLAIFAFFHALHEWLEMYRHLRLIDADSLLIYVGHISLLIALVSFLFLFLFGITLNTSLLKNLRQWLWIFFGLMLIIFLTHMLLLLPWNDAAMLRSIEYDMRLLIALPATLLTAAGFFLYARQLITQGLRGAYNFIGAGAAFVAYGIFTGAIPSGTVLLLPIEIWRATSAFIILHFLMYALDTFMDQREEMITERLQLAANSEKLSAIGRLAAGIAHEINNPLANASLQMEMLRQHQEIKDLPEKVAGRLTTVEKSIDKSSHIAKELLIFAGGKTPDTELVQVSLKPIIKSAWEMAAYRSSNHQFSNHITALPPVNGSHIKLEELFLNLFLNAIDAMPEGGTLELTGRVDADEVIIRVTDTGTGISPENLARVMEPFFTTKEVGQGTGLGLSICYGIMNQHGGSIEIAPRDGVRGAQVTLKFPLRSENKPEKRAG
ncbi:sensor histidine kinase [Pelovirga terrestris]|uniref:histidine kinase n=1 Tax=Pelovirga terrestris TaxID=2771352 RepID=A0A8J6UQ75_9BACT|nr:ATP-binding protein [Pelovirga terrestris]MBD1401699.1 sensor histidine kinase [Pelovirga terrestris]